MIFRLESRPPPAGKAVPFYVYCFMGAVDAAQADVISPLSMLRLMMAASRVICLRQIIAIDTNGTSRHDRQFPKSLEIM